MASTTFDLPQPLGPMIADTFPGKVSSTSSGNDLKPETFSEFRRICAIEAVTVAEPGAAW